MTSPKMKRWECPLCGRQPQDDCGLCRGTGKFYSGLPAQLRRYRQREEWSLEAVASDLGVSASVLSRLERGVTLCAPSWSQRQAAGRLLLRYLQLARHRSPGSFPA
jgi:AraC-like DNA-binding protein